MVHIPLKPFKSAWYFQLQNQNFSKVHEIRDAEKKRKLVQLDNLFILYLSLTFENMTMLWIVVSQTSTFSDPGTIHITPCNQVTADLQLWKFHFGWNNNQLLIILILCFISSYFLCLSQAGNTWWWCVRGVRKWYRCCLEETWPALKSYRAGNNCHRLLRKMKNWERKGLKRSYIGNNLILRVLRTKFYMRP